ncbi:MULTISPECIES: family 43 glycosylhydrolase [unclassified Knoellia]|uniref:family 43 glycosylhydrolase n=1 Tax=Knoellia altitudinis TaxID=3404795 RepID=UPI0036159AE1
MRIRQLLVSAATAVGLIAVTAGSASASTIASPLGAADPGFTRIGSSYYLAATGSGETGTMPVFRRSSPTGAYAKIGNINAARSGYSKFWAPHLVKRGSYYFAFFSASYNGAKPCVYYASSTTVVGGYSAPRLLTCGGGSGREAIDATTYVTTEGNTYLTWRSGVHRLGFPRGDYDIIARMLAFGGSTVKFATGSANNNLLHRTSDDVYEAPSIVRRGGKVWLFVSRNRYDTNAYYTAVYSADSIHGTFTFRKNLMKTGQGYGYGPGGAEVETAADGSTWIAYHVWKESKPYPSTPGKRILRTAKLDWVNGLPVVR